MLVIKMKSILVELNCKHCMYQSHKQSETLIIPEFEPYLREQLLDDTFFVGTCLKCGSQIEFLHTCIYNAKKQGFILLMKPEKEQRVADHSLYQDDVCTKRYLSNHKDIPEKIHILEDHVDDRVIEIMKVKLRLRAKQNLQQIESIIYHDIDLASKTIWFKIEQDGEQKDIAITLESYHNLLQTLPKEDTSRFHEVTISWAIAFLANND